VFEVYNNEINDLLAHREHVSMVIISNYLLVELTFGENYLLVKILRLSPEVPPTAFSLADTTYSGTQWAKSPK